MNAVKRYGAYLPHDAPIEAVANVCERPDGEFVAHLDYVRLEARLAESERDIDQLVGERDHVETMADKLADAIATLLGVEIGEHSSGNCPWQNALDAFEDESLSAGRGNAADGESRPCAPSPARGLRAQAATAEVVDSAERRSPDGHIATPSPDESHRHDACGYTLEPPR